MRFLASEQSEEIILLISIRVLWKFKVNMAAQSVPLIFVAGIECCRSPPPPPPFCFCFVHQDLQLYLWYNSRHFLVKVMQVAKSSAHHSLTFYCEHWPSCAEAKHHSLTWHYALQERWKTSQTVWLATAIMHTSRNIWLVTLITVWLATAIMHTSRNIWLVTLIMYANEIITISLVIKTVYAPFVFLSYPFKLDCTLKTIACCCSSAFEDLVFLSWPCCEPCICWMFSSCTEMFRCSFFDLNAVCLCSGVRFCPWKLGACEKLKQKN